MVWRFFPKFGQKLVHFLAGDWACGNIDELMGFPMVKSHIATLGMNGQAVAVSPLLRRRKHGADFNITDSANAAQ